MKIEELSDHNYSTKVLKKMEEIEEINQKKLHLINNAVDRVVSRVDISNSFTSTSKAPLPFSTSSQSIPLTNKSVEDAINQQINDDMIKINIKDQVAVEPINYLNHIDVTQNSDSWLKNRKKRITGSRLGILLGLNGKESLKSIGTWF